MTCTVESINTQYWLCIHSSPDFFYLRTTKDFSCLHTGNDYCMSINISEGRKFCYLTVLFNRRDAYSLNLYAMSSPRGSSLMARVAVKILQTTWAVDTLLVILAINWLSMGRMRKSSMYVLHSRRLMRQVCWIQCSNDYCLYLWRKIPMCTLMAIKKRLAWLKCIDLTDWN